MFHCNDFIHNQWSLTNIKFREKTIIQLGDNESKNSIR